MTVHLRVAAALQVITPADNSGYKQRRRGAWVKEFDFQAEWILKTRLRSEESSSAYSGPSYVNCAHRGGIGEKHKPHTK